MREGEPTSWRKPETIANDNEPAPPIERPEPTSPVLTDAIQAHEKEDLDAVRQRLGLSGESDHNEAVDTKESGSPTPAEDLWSDSTYAELRKEIYQRNRDKADDLIDYEAEQEFRRTSPDTYKEYQALEAKHIYRDSSGNPRLENDRFYKRMFLPRSVGGMGYDSNSNFNEMNARMNMVSQYPEKAAAYAETDEALKRMLENNN